MISPVFLLLTSLNVIKLPASSIKLAEERYGKLDSDYKLTEKSMREHLVLFDFSVFGLPKKQFKKTRVNIDIVLPLTLVLSELKLTGLISELTEFKGCFASRPVRGTDRPSIHAFGLGCDFDNKKFSERFVQVWEKYNWSWGGRWCSPDNMHFSYAWEPSLVGKDIECSSD